MKPMLKQEHITAEAPDPFERIPVSGYIPRSTKGTRSISRSVRVWLRIPRHSQSEVVVSYVNFPWRMSPCVKSKICILSKDIDDQRILKSDWTRAF